MPELTLIPVHTCMSNVHWARGVGGYSVTYDHNGWHCSCPHHKFRHVECKHIKAVKSDRCGWNWEAYCGSTAKPDMKDGVYVCPDCGGPIETFNVGV